MAVAASAALARCGPTKREQTLKPTPYEMMVSRAYNGIINPSRLQTVPIASTRPVAAQAVFDRQVVSTGPITAGGCKFLRSMPGKTWPRISPISIEASPAATPRITGAENLANC